MFEPYSFERALRAIDDRLYGYVPTETSIQDRRSLLALHNACRDHYGEFSYLEIGSHLGGSLQVALVDPRCTAVTSIDSRPLWMPDEHREPLHFPENTTERMLRYLDFVPDADLTKLRTVEATTEGLSPADFTRAHLCLIDGEHTVKAALRDARFCRAVLQDEGVIAFHDRQTVRPAIDEFVAELPEHQSYPLPNALWIVTLGSATFEYRVQEMLAPFVERFARAVAERASQ